MHFFPPHSSPRAACRAAQNRGAREITFRPHELGSNPIASYRGGWFGAEVDLHRNGFRSAASSFNPDCNIQRNASFGNRPRSELVHSVGEAVSCPNACASAPAWIVQTISLNNQSGGGGGCFGFGPNARAVFRCARFTFDRASWLAYSRSPNSLYWGLVSEARNATTSSISGSVSANGCMSLSSQGLLIPSPLL